MSLTTWQPLELVPVPISPINCSGRHCSHLVTLGTTWNIYNTGEYCMGILQSERQDSATLLTPIIFVSCMNWTFVLWEGQANWHVSNLKFPLFLTPVLCRNNHPWHSLFPFVCQSHHCVNETILPEGKNQISFQGTINICLFTECKHDASFILKCPWISVLYCIYF